MAAAFLIALSPALAVAGPATGLPHASPDLYSFFDQSGCAVAGSAHPSFSVKTGVGHAAVHASGHTCYPTKGGYLVDTYGSGDAQVGAQETLHLAKSYTNLNTTWNVNAAWLLNASGKIKFCPTHYYNFTGTGYYGNTSYTYYFNESYQDCYAEAGVEYYLETEVYDQTTGQYAFNFGPFNYSNAGVYVDNYSFSETYVPAVFSNYSYSCTTCYGSLGPGGSGSINTNLYSNLTGTWSTGDTITITATIWSDAYIEIYNAHAAKCAASFNAESAHHLDLTAFQLT